MGNCPAEGGLCRGAGRVIVDELPVQCDGAKLIYHFLIDGLPVRHTYFSAEAILECGEGCIDKGHGGLVRIDFVDTILTSMFFVEKPYELKKA